MKLAFVLVVAVLSLLAAGCGGEEPLSPDEWAEEFCTIVNDWGTELDGIRDDLGDVSSLTSESVEDAADEADTVTEDMIESLRDLGAPDTASGDAIEQEVEEVADTVDSEREALREAIGEIDGLTGLAEAVGQVGTSIAAMTTELSQTLQAIADQDVEGEVRTAIEDSETCDELTQ